MWREILFHHCGAKIKCSFRGAFKKTEKERKAKPESGRADIMTAPCRFPKNRKKMQLT
jgi:hypothetical protein